MKRWLGTAVLSLALLVACGGGDSSTPVVDLAHAPLAKADPSACPGQGFAMVGGDCLAVMTELAPARRDARPVPAQHALPVLTPQDLFSWAPGAFPQFFRGAFEEGFFPPYVYRRYPATGNYLAVANGNVYVLIPSINSSILHVGTLSSFTCSVFNCSSGGGGTGGTVDWNSSFSAEEIVELDQTLGANQRVGQAFTVTGGSLPVETIFTAQFSASMYLTTADTLAACVNGGSFSYFQEWSFLGQFGYQAMTLPPGAYGVCVQNNVNASNTMRVEFQNQPTVDGFHYLQQRFNTVTRSVPAGGRLTQGATSGDSYRVIVDGANTGGTFYIIPADQEAAFLSAGTFNYYPDLTSGCSSGHAAPGLCELTGVGNYMIAYVNDTGAAQSIVIIGRDYVPD